MEEKNQKTSQVLRPFIFSLFLLWAPSGRSLHTKERHGRKAIRGSRSTGARERGKKGTTKAKEIGRNTIQDTHRVFPG